MPRKYSKKATKCSPSNGSQKRKKRKARKSKKAGCKCCNCKSMCDCKRSIKSKAKKSRQPIQNKGACDCGCKTKCNCKEARVGTGYGKAQGSGSTYSHQNSISVSSPSESSTIKDWRMCNAELVDSISGKPFRVEKIMLDCGITKAQANELLNGLKLKVLINALRSLPNYRYLDKPLSNILDAMEEHRKRNGFRYLPVKFNTKKSSKLKKALSNNITFKKIVTSLNVHDFVNLLVKNSLWKASSNYRMYVCGVMNYIKITKKRDKHLLKLICSGIQFNQPIHGPVHRQGINVNEHPQLFLSEAESLEMASSRSTSKELSSLHGFNTTSLSPKGRRAYSTNITA